MKRKPLSIGPQKEKILEHASTLFWKHGYSSASMRDIANACKCKPANIYNYFHNKEDILFECLITQNVILIEKIKHFENDLITQPSEQLREFILIHISHVLAYHKTSRSLFDTGLERLSKNNRRKVIIYRDAYDRILAGIIQRGIETKEFKKIDTKLAARNIASMIVRTIIWYSPKGQMSVKDVAEFIFDFSVNGLKKQ